MLNIEFFHSTVCGHCFIMSARLRKITDKYKNIAITHRSHPLRWDENHVDETFNTKEEKRADMFRKWETANRIDDDHRFNIEGMKHTDFEEPYARLSMIAIRAGILAGGNAWDLFDLFQEAIYMKNQNIGDEEIIAQLIEETELDFKTWLTYYEDPKTEALEIKDFEHVEEYGLKLVPTMVVEKKHIIEGTKRLDLAEDLLIKAAAAEGIQLIEK